MAGGRSLSCVAYGTQKRDNKPKRKFKERHKRLPKDQINILDYKNLLIKIINKLAKDYGLFVYDYEEDLLQTGYVALIAAWEKYDKTRGTFVTIAWLRAHTYMQRQLFKYIKEYVATVNLEDLKFSDSEDNMGWQDLFPSQDVDYFAVAKVGIRDYDDVGWLLFEALCNGKMVRSWPKLLGLNKEETAEAYADLRSDLLAACAELYPEVN